MKNLLILLSVFLITQNAIAQTCITKSPSTEADEANGGTSSWTLNNAATSNNVYDVSASLANSTSYTSRLKLTGFAFAIPATAIIQGISVNVERSISANVNVSDREIMLVKAGVTQTGTNKANATLWTTTDANATYGNSTDLWSNTWTPADINSASFGVAIAAQRNVNPGAPLTARVDFVSITVCYTTLVPLKIERFEVVKTIDNNANVLLQTSNEINVANLQLQKSNDGMNFYNLLNFNPKSGSINTYTVSDNLIANGNTYYRFKIVDLNGRFEYSEIRYITVSGKNNNIADVNFVNNKLDILICNKPNNYSLIVYDFNGKKYFSKNITTIKEITSLSIPLELDKNKFYIVVINGSGFKVSKKFFVSY
jgi:hypothetical protein